MVNQRPLMGTAVLEDPWETVPVERDEAQDDPQAIRLVCCLIRPERLEAVRDAVDALHVAGGMTVTDVRGFGRQKGQVEHYRGGEYTIRFLPKVKIEWVVRAEHVPEVLGAVRKAAGTGQIGDGKAFVLDVVNAVRIRTGERGSGAL